jgi:glycosyltransferase involved in cell wall biosynthesis
MPALSVVAPIFTDETETIRYAAGVFSAAAERAVGSDYEILFTDDGSAARALDCVRDLERRDPRVRLLGDGRHRGLGTAVRRGFEAAGGEFILYTDGDGQVACSELADAWPALRDHDLIVGFRTERREGPVRRLGTRVLAAAAGPFLGRRLRDVDCAFKLARAGFLRDLRLRSRGTGVDAEIVLRASRRGARILEIPVRHTPPFGRTSRVTPARIAYGTVEFLAALCRPD